MIVVKCGREILCEFLCVQWIGSRSRYRVIRVFSNVVNEKFRVLKTKLYEVVFADKRPNLLGASRRKRLGHLETLNPFLK
jgi:hypothetical protein